MEAAFIALPKYLFKPHVTARYSLGASNRQSSTPL